MKWCQSVGWFRYTLPSCSQKFVCNSHNEFVRTLSFFDCCTSAFVHKKWLFVLPLFCCFCKQQKRKITANRKKVEFRLALTAHLFSTIASVCRYKTCTQQHGGRTKLRTHARKSRTVYTTFVLLTECRNWLFFSTGNLFSEYIRRMRKQYNNKKWPVVNHRARIIVTRGAWRECNARACVSSYVCANNFVCVSTFFCSLYLVGFLPFFFARNQQSGLYNTSKQCVVCKLQITLGVRSCNVIRVCVNFSRYSTLFCPPSMFFTQFIYIHHLKSRSQCCLFARSLYAKRWM